MKVIAAGFPKTGTKSMQAALHELGYVVYDWMENFQYLNDEWTKIFKEGGSTEDFRRMFQNVDAVTDIPSSNFWEEIHKAFPDAKIILTMRENEDDWAESCENQWKKNSNHLAFYFTYLSPTMYKMWKFGDLVSYATFGTVGERSLFKPMKISMTLARMAYRRHNSHVLQTAPKDKLLVYSVKEGWEPLCEFLQVEVPEKPFPHKNIRGRLIDEMVAKHPVLIRAQREIYISTSMIAVILGFGVYKFVKSSSSNWLKEAFNCFRNYFSL